MDSVSTFAAVPEWVAAGAFGLVTLFTLLLRNVPELQANLLYAVFFYSTSSLYMLLNIAHTHDLKFLRILLLICLKHLLLDVLCRHIYIYVITLSQIPCWRRNKSVVIPPFFEVCSLPQCSCIFFLSLLMNFFFLLKLKFLWFLVCEFLIIQVNCEKST